MAKTRERSRMTVVHSWDEVPTFASEAEESAFWATHQLDEVLLAQMTPEADESLPAPRPRTKPIALRFDETVILRAKAVASRRGKGYQTLLKEFVSERLYEEEKREGIVGNLPREAHTLERQFGHRDAARSARPKQKRLTARERSSTTRGAAKSSFTTGVASSVTRTRCRQGTTPTRHATGGSGCRTGLGRRRVQKFNHDAHAARSYSCMRPDGYTNRDTACDQRR